jgi:DNA mismatch endonuclease (patch repair protein)
MSHSAGLFAVKVPRPPPASSAATTAVMKANRAERTGPELRFRKALTARGLRGYRTNFRGMPGRPDVVFPRGQLAIFVHGCFWHQHGCPRSAKALPKSNPEYWRLKFILNRERDARKIAQLEVAGWGVLVVWECEVRANPGRSARKVEIELSRRRANAIPSGVRNKRLERCKP